MRQWYQVKLQADPSVAEIYIVDYIGDWVDQQIAEFWSVELAVTAKAFIEELAALPETVTAIRVHINSPGGDVFGAITIANALRDQRVTKGRTVETVVDGLAASAASLVAMAGSPMRMADNALLMIHDAWSVAMGNARDMRKTADLLDQIRDGQIVPTYQWHSQLPAEDIVNLMAGETWMDAQEAVDFGFADEVVQGLRAAASIDPRGAAKLRIPEKYEARVRALLKPAEAEAAAKPAAAAAVDVSLPGGKAEELPAAPAAAEAVDIVRAVAEAGLDVSFAQALIGEGLTPEAVQARVGAEQQARAAAATRATEIRALCTKVKQGDLADGYIKGSMPVSAVKDHLLRITAKLDKAEIDAGLDPENGHRASGAKARIDVVQLYADRNRLAAKN